MSLKKDNILKRIGEFMDTLLKEEKPEEKPVEQIEQTEEKPTEKKRFAVEDFPVGQPLPDGEYEIDDCILVIKGGIVESCMPKEAPEEKPVEEAPIEEEKKEEKPVEMASEIETKLRKEFEDKFNAQKEAFDAELAKIANANKSGIIQAPVPEPEPRALSAKEIIMKNIENRK